LEHSGLEILSKFPCEAVPAQAADIYADIKNMRQRNGRALDENDLWVAATAMALGATLVSRDEDFVGIAGLPVLNLDG
jgi:predicted nucleic acid-binding protein